MNKTAARWCGLLALVLSGSAAAGEFDLGWGITGTSKALLSAGLGWRTDTPDGRMLFKLNHNPGLCQNNIAPPGGNTTAVSSVLNPTPGITAGCYSFTGDQSLNQKVVDAPGAYFGANRDDGNFNYHQGSLTNALAKVSSDVTLSWEDFTFKAAAIGFYDPRNYSKTEYHPDSSYQPAQTTRASNSAHQSGKTWVLRDLLVNSKFSVLEHDFNATVGYQHIRWGESTLVALNSMSEINAPDARLLFQPATQVADIFRPTPAVLIGTPLIENVNLDLIYLLGWDGVVLPDGGQFEAPLDVVGRDFATLSLGAFHEDPHNMQRAPGIAADLTDTSFTVGFREVHPRQQGQFGAKLTWFAPEINGGTEFGFYALNYHSRFPYLGFDAAQKTCVKDTTVDFFQAADDCKGTKAVAGGLELFPADTIRARFDYPEDIHMVGMSFNTNLGKWSLAGEFSYRPNLPVQVSAPDVIYMAAQPAVPKNDICVNYASLVPVLAPGVSVPQPAGAPSTCQSPSLASIANGTDDVLRVLASPRGFDFLSTFLLNPTTTLALPSPEHIAPSFLRKYRGVDQVVPGSHVPGYERLQVLQFDFTGIRALGATDNPVGADQIIIIAELGGTWAIDMPSLEKLQFEGGDFNETHYGAGADGSCDPPGTPKGFQPDGAYAASRLNPHCQRKGYASPFAAGYRLIMRGEYNNIFELGWNYKPTLIWAHDIYGVAIQPVGNFNRGTMTWQLINEFELSQQWNTQIYYQGSTGGGTRNALRDKDTAGIVFNYSF